MLTVKREGVILENTTNEFENDSVLNPAVIADGNTVHLFYRAVRTGNHSSIGYCRLEGPLQVVERSQSPLLFPQFDYESKGVEDPRIVYIDKCYYLTYTAYDGHNVMGALAVSKNLKQWDKLGVITPQLSYDNFKETASTEENQESKYFRFDSSQEAETMSGKKLYVSDKDLVLFPRKINGKFYLMHRIKPDIQLIAVEYLAELTTTFWHDYFLHFENHILLRPVHPHESSYIGAGCPPIETPEGWVLIYHSVRDTIDGYIYSASAALLDLEHPEIELSRLNYPLFGPETEYELTGIVNRVCFPTGAVQFGDRLYIYYGAADKCIACASVVFTELVDELLKNKK